MNTVAVVLAQGDNHNAGGGVLLAIAIGLILLFSKGSSQK